MRWSIRQQVLVPIVAIQTLSIAAITIASMALAARRTERQIVERLSGVVDALGGSNFPLTDGILARMHSLSGARFVAYGPAGQPVAASDPGLAASAPALQAIPVRSQDHFDSLSDSPTLAVRGQNHFAALIGPRSSTSGTALLVLYPELSWRDARWESAQVPLILGAGALALMAAATTWIAHRISGRIHRLEHQVARIAEGDFRELALDPKPPRDEVNDLARSINRMCTQLRQMSQRIRQSERTHMLAQLAAGMAHQLRNALTGARLSIQLHLKRCEDARTDTSMTVALRQLTLMEEQVRGLLTLSRPEERPHTSCDLVRLLHDVASLLQPTSEHARVAFRVGTGPPTATAMADEPSLRAAVLNLALNAIEAAGPGGSVALELRNDSHTRVIEVTDTGPGPPSQLGETLFEPFVTGKPEGVGLGLALARHVALAHHGSVSWAREGAFTRFRLTLPSGSQESEAG
ncbi:MAG: HAMP domain-containing sensor histidine kinase [Isosphaeraceae bacterium]|jgi:signal transduction histidine kinase